MTISGICSLEIIDVFEIICPRGQLQRGKASSFFSKHIYPFKKTESKPKDKGYMISKQKCTKEPTMRFLTNSLDSPDSSHRTS